MTASPLSSASSSSSLYPSSSWSSIHSSPSLGTNLTLSSYSPSPLRPLRPCTRAQLESLIVKHGYPTPVSLSSLQDLTATSSTYNPPSPYSPPLSPTAELSDFSETLILTRPATRPIPIPKRPANTSDIDLPVTPLTGRFDKGSYFPQSHQAFAPVSNKERRHHPESGRHRPRSYHHRFSGMRSDTSTFYPIMSPTLSPPGRSSSPQPPRSRSQNSSKSGPALHLANLPRFHPAVYQHASNSQILPAQPPSPLQPRQNSYRAASGSRDGMWQYREFVESVTFPKAPSRPLSPNPSAPRLDPLRSPGPVTPLELEDTGGYLAIGASSSLEFSSRDPQQAVAAQDLVERLIARENERTRQKSWKNVKGR